DHRALDAERDDPEQARSPQACIAPEPKHDAALVLLRDSKSGQRHDDDGDEADLPERQGHDNAIGWNRTTRQVFRRLPVSRIRSRSVPTPPRASLLPPASEPDRTNTERFRCRLPSGAGT